MHTQGITGWIEKGFNNQSSKTGVVVQKASRTKWTEGPNHKQQQEQITDS